MRCLFAAVVVVCFQVRAGTSNQRHGALEVLGRMEPPMLQCCNCYTCSSRSGTIGGFTLPSLAASSQHQWAKPRRLREGKLKKFKGRGKKFLKRMRKRMPKPKKKKKVDLWPRRKREKEEDMSNWLVTGNENDLYNLTRREWQAKIDAGEMWSKREHNKVQKWLAKQPKPKQDPKLTMDPEKYAARREKAYRKAIKLAAKPGYWPGLLLDEEGLKEAAQLAAARYSQEEIAEVEAAGSRLHEIDWDKIDINDWSHLDERYPENDDESEYSEESNETSSDENLEEDSDYGSGSEEDSENSGEDEEADNQTDDVDGGEVDGGKVDDGEVDDGEVDDGDVDDSCCNSCKSLAQTSFHSVSVPAAALLGLSAGSGVTVALLPFRYGTREPLMAA
eukprot:gnl/TRDRNA2_/TRDRNA2_156175_c0_seq1.p1 gnl/TRDRNA2_/TRDRNA2_156175_c0~~gnl/TRDRNA2_/TRDRNA2_156175_c0_seq1.p1  ORF type:complete len:390 (-),score=86.31 gnl/TRDRNA2_/TRDRNA2_156175_c0_seq1:155-1324(-)